jgi:plasmid maintenance system antidote protein VapI
MSTPCQDVPKTCHVKTAEALGPDLWLNVQKRYDLRRAARELGEKIKAIPTLEVA